MIINLLFFILQGKWEPRKIPNPDYFDEPHPYKLTPIGSIALELWSMVDNVVFDNFIITSDQSVAKQYADQIWYPKSVLEGKAISAASESVIDAIVKATKDRPWLWAVYLIAIILPLVILFVFCWSKKPTKKSSDASRKKTDEPDQDSTGQQLSSGENDEEVEEIEINEQQTQRKAANASGKDALENDDEEQETNVSRLIFNSSFVYLLVLFKTNEAAEEDANKSSSPSPSSKPRRRVRKE